MKIIFAGTPEFAATALAALLKTSHQIIAVYTQPDRKSGRGQKLTPSPVKQLALEHNLPVYQPLNFKASTEEGLAARQELAALGADVMVVAAYGLILPQAVLDTPKYGCLNIHGSLLPRWRGAAPIQRAIATGDTETGITIMQMAQGLDTGDMLYKIECPITDTDTTQLLHDKLAKLGGEAIVTVLSDLENYQQKAEKQDDALANYAEKITTAEGEINWQNDAISIQRQIRALNAFTYLDEHKDPNSRIKIIKAAPIKLDQQTHEPAGKIVSVGRNAILVACGKNASNHQHQGVQHLINITQMQWPGGKPLTAEQIANGDKLNDGDIFHS